MMKSRSLGRPALVLAGLVCLFAVFATPAFGAGKPTVQSGGGFVVSGHLGPNQAELGAFVNPNGAATTVQILYRLPLEEEFQATAPKEIGSGTEYVQYTGQAFPLVRGQTYEIQIKATNSYGITQKVGKSLKINWIIYGESEGSPNPTSAYAASGGPLKTEWLTTAGVKSKIECSGVSGSGEFGPKAKSEGLNLNTSGCKYYVGNVFQCNILPITLNLDSGFGQSGSFYTSLCNEGGEWPITFGTFAVNDNTVGYAVTHSMTMTAQGSFTTRAATTTITSNWQLSAENVGKKFGLLPF